MIILLQIVALAAAGGLFLLFAYIFCTVLVLPFTRGALFVPTSRVRVRAILDAVPMTENQLLVDLGCGDGRMLREAELRYGVRGIGYELNPFAYLKARLNCFVCKRLQSECVTSGMSTWERLMWCFAIFSQMCSRTWPKSWFGKPRQVQCWFPVIFLYQG